MAVYRSTFPIAASAATIWNVLTDFERYPDWNPSLPSISGELRPGATVALTLGMPGRPSPKVKATLREVAVGRRLTWHGNAGADWLFAGDREFVIDEQPDGTVLFTHVEDVHGALFPIFCALMGGAIQRGTGDLAYPIPLPHPYLQCGYGEIEPLGNRQEVLG
jgi:hypothetical protein